MAPEAQVIQEDQRDTTSGNKPSENLDSSVKRPAGGWPFKKLRIRYTKPDEGYGSVADAGPPTVQGWVSTLSGSGEVELVHCVIGELPAGTTGVRIACAEETTTSPPGVLPAIVSRDDWHVLTDQSTPLAERRSMLGALIDLSDRKLPDFLARELARRNLPAEWRDVLLIAAEWVDFDDIGNRKSVATSLFRHAITLRDENRANSIGPLFAAMRRFATLVPECDAERLLEFLRVNDDQAVRQVGLQGIQNIFSNARPGAGVGMEGLLERVGELAEKYTDRDWATSGENAAIAIDAVFAAATLGHSEVERLVERVVQWRKPHLARQLADLLEKTLAVWSSFDCVAMIDAEPVARLRTCMQTLVQYCSAK